MANSEPKPNQQPEKGIDAVNLALDIVEATYELDGAGVTELSDYLDIPKSTVHVHLQTLVSNGYLVQLETKYHIGYKFFNLGAGKRSRSDLYRAASPEVRKISAETGELVDLLVEENGRGVLLYTSGGDRAIDDNTPIGSFVELHTSAVGKSILAFLPRDCVQQIISNHGLVERTPNTITNEEELFDQLDKIRDRQLAFNEGERTKGIRAVGTPILTEDEQVLGAISITGPMHRMTDERIEDDLRDSLLRSKNVIELKVTHY